jgi:predicted dehydrogenase
VLGTHLFDLIRLFAGDPESCTAQVLQEGREIRREDARPATEQIGPVAGDTLYAQFLLPGGVQASFTSRKELRALAGHWGLELLGTAGAVRVLADLSPAVHVARPGPWTRDGRELAWRRWEGDPTRDAPENGAVAANRRMVDQWIRSIEENGKPICSGEDGRWALEMAHAVYASSLSGRRVRFPLAGRGHPLAGEG